MKFGHRHYVPCLRWKQGEYKAISLLSDTAKQLITPLIEVPEIGFDFETWTPKKTVDEHLVSLPKRIKKNWQDKPCFVDVNLIPPDDRMKNGLHPVRFIFEQLRILGCYAIPVTGPNRDAAYKHAVLQTCQTDQNGMCIRISIEEAASPDIGDLINNLMGKKLKAQECDLILDLQAPTFQPIADFAKLIQEIIQQLPHLNFWRTFSLIGTSFPENMGEIKSTQEIIPRHEWSLYKTLAVALSKSKTRIPTFGDYAINHPEVIQKDMRLLKPGGTIRYAIDDAWLIIKGPNVRDNGFGQYVGHCKKVLASTSYAGAVFSEGDKYIFDCANGNASTGNLSTWRWVGTNHHMERVAQDVASFFDV